MPQVDPEHGFSIPWQRLSGVSQLQRLTLAGVHPEQRWQQHKGHLQAAQVRLGAAMVQPRLHQDRVVAGIAQRHDDFLFAFGIDKTRARDGQVGACQRRQSRRHH